MKCSGCIAVCLIISGANSLICIFIVNYGFYSIFRFAFQIGMRLVPLNENWEFWVAVPVPLHIKIFIMSRTVTNSVLPDGLGTGRVTVDLDMEPWTGGSQNMLPVLWVEEEANVDTLQKYLMGFEDSINYVKCLCWTVGLSAVVLAILSLTMLLLQNKKKRKVDLKG